MGTRSKKERITIEIADLYKRTLDDEASQFIRGFSKAELSCDDESITKQNLKK